MMNPRKNFLAFLNHEYVDYIPVPFMDVAICGGGAETFENGPAGGGKDGFGCNWIPTESTNGQVALDPFTIVLEDVCDWEDVVTFPDLDAFDWQAFADEQLAGVDRTQKVVGYYTWNSIFLRFTHLLGFENALCSLYEEPEASQDLINAITDYKIRLIDYADKYFHPDTYVTYEDIATEKSTFVSPETYRKFFKPCHTRMNEAMEAHGAIPQKHTCGRCEEILEDYVDEGVAAWQAAQPSNDLKHIIETMGDRLGVIGGYDTQGRPGAPGVTPEEVVAEVDRCYEEYGCYGRGYAFQGFVIGAAGDPDYQTNMGALLQRTVELREQGK